MDNKILPFVQLILKLTKTHPLFFTLFAKNTAAAFLLVAKMAASQFIIWHSLCNIFYLLGWIFLAVILLDGKVIVHVEELTD